MSYISTKTYGHDFGLSCAFRQYKAKSHCHFLHGYAISVKVEFEANLLDHRNWVVDFGGLKSFKEELKNLFDHKVIVAEDDPLIDWYRRGDELGALELIVMPQVGCEYFAYHISCIARAWLHINKLTPRCTVKSVEVREHGANSAIFNPPNPPNAKTQYEDPDLD